MWLRFRYTSESECYIGRAFTSLSLSLMLFVENTLTGERCRRVVAFLPATGMFIFTKRFSVTSTRNHDHLQLVCTVNRYHSPADGRVKLKRSNCAFSTVRGQRLSPAVDNDSLEVTTSTRSRTRSSRRDGRCACHMRARRLDDAVDGPRAPQSGAAQQEQPPWLHDVNHTYHRTHLLLSAALHDLTPTFSR